MIKKLSQSLSETMSLADCEEEITQKDPPNGFELYCSTQRGSQFDCDVPPSGSHLEIDITNKRPNPISVIINCESTNGHVEFHDDGDYEKEWRDTVLIEGRTSHGGSTKTVSIDLQSTVSSKTTETIEIDMSENNLMMPGKPPINKNIKVNATN